MSHQLRTEAANKVWGLLLSDREDEIEEADLLAIEEEAMLRQLERSIQDEHGKNVTLGPSGWQVTREGEGLRAALEAADRLAVAVVQWHSGAMESLAAEYQRVRNDAGTRVDGSTAGQPSEPHSALRPPPARAALASGEEGQ